MTSPSVAPCRVAEIDSWTDEADVVVVGFGAAGTAAAYEAASANASVLVLERTSASGGAAAMSDGMIYLGGGTATQRGAGFEDSVENMTAFLTAACGPAPDEAKIAAYCAGTVEHHDWLVARGVQFAATFRPDGGGTSPLDGEGLMYTGGENAYPFDELVPPAPRAHVVQGGRPGGAALMTVLTQAALDAGARPSYDTSTERLVVDDGGRVCGVIVSRYGEGFAIRARTGVVLTAGGFINNPEMVEQYAPVLHLTGLRLGTEGDDGRGIRMAQGAGARVKRMDAVECALPFNAPRGLVHGILVNRLGQRFVNEDTYMGRIGQRALVAQGAEVYLIVDEAHYAPNWLGVPAAWVCATAAELSAEIGLPDRALVETLDYFNQHAAQGVDPLFHKRPPALTPLTPPLAAFDLRADKFPYAPFTLGGLHTLPSGEVLDVDGEPIAGLYAAGRTTSGVAAQGYCSGLSLGDSTFFGRRAGLSAAGAKP
ncbi:MAG: fumarate reductase/succinate dehydrogenase flavoprotein-like protein [Pseudonocardiales bacterium]|nr:fumarate reductase/succinate dehydrogenase flavoprotein-like protein [Pseudonocardiales bacterium]